MRAMAIETRVAEIIGRQERAGVQYDSTRAKFYVHALEEETLGIYRRIRPFLSMEVTQPYAVPVHKPFLISGDYSSSVLKWYGEESDKVAAPFTRVEFKEPDINKRGQIIKQLLRLGWKPRKYTEPTDSGGGCNPQIAVDGEPCPSLLEISSTVGADLSRWYRLKKRQSTILGQLKLVREDGRLEARAFTIGTPTFRFRHRGLVNVPKAEKSVLFGRQMRSLFTVKDGYKLVGHDAKGLELRMLAHYIDDEEFIHNVAFGDPHTANQLAAGLPTRDSAKTFILSTSIG